VAGALLEPRPALQRREAEAAGTAKTAVDRALKTTDAAEWPKEGYPLERVLLCQARPELQKLAELQDEQKGPQDRDRWLRHSMWHQGQK
jgi:hypothetical protein